MVLSYFMWLKEAFVKSKNIISCFKNKVKVSPLYWRTLIAFFLVAFVVKILVAYFSNRYLNPIQSCLSYISSDIIILLFAHLLVTINSWINVRGFRLFNDLIVFILLIIYCVDIFTIYFFQSRVSIVDALVFWSNWSSGFDVVAWLYIFAFLVIGISLFLIIQTKKNIRICR